MLARELMRAVMRLACAVEWRWVAPLLPRLESADPERLLAGGVQPASAAATSASHGHDAKAAEDASPAAKRKRAEEEGAAAEKEGKAAAARERFLQRKAGSVGVVSRR